MATRIKLPIENEADLERFVNEVLGIKIPKKAVVDGHSSPWAAFCAAFFANDPVILWWGSRGFAGKTYTLAALAVTLAVALGIDVSVLGGSYQQSLHVRRYIQRFIGRRQLNGWVQTIKQDEVIFTNGATITALSASQTAVRGPHPVRLLLDECDEMPETILQAALGQPMAKGDIPAGVVCSSTWQYPDGTFAHLLKDAAGRGWPVMTWGYQETTRPNGWLSQSDVDRKKSTVSSNMWSIEYDLGTPSAENRAIDPGSVEAMFNAALGTFEGSSGELCVIEQPEPGARYIHGADLGRKKDFTVHIVIRVDCQPARVVAFYKTRRLPWSVIMGKVNNLRNRYPGSLAYDQTGVGDAAGEFLDGVINGVVMVGRMRTNMLNAAITAVEKGGIESPLITSFKNDLLYASTDDVFGAGHLPDSFSALALAWTLFVDAGQVGWVVNPFTSWPDAQTEEAESGEYNPDLGWVFGWSHSPHKPGVTVDTCLNRVSGCWQCYRELKASGFFKQPEQFDNSADAESRELNRQYWRDRVADETIKASEVKKSFWDLVKRS